MIDSIRLLKKDILITPFNKNDLGESVIHLIDDGKQEDSLNYFEVLKVSEKVVEVKKGDIIILSIGNHTAPVMVDNKRVAITSEEDVEAVVEL